MKDDLKIGIILGTFMSFGLLICSSAASAQIHRISPINNALQAIINGKITEKSSEFGVTVERYKEIISDENAKKEILNSYLENERALERRCILNDDYECLNAITSCMKKIRNETLGEVDKIKTTED